MSGVWVWEDEAVVALVRQALEAALTLELVALPGDAARLAEAAAAVPIVEEQA